MGGMSLSGGSMFSEAKGREQIHKAVSWVMEDLPSLPVNTNDAETASILLTRIDEHEGVWGVVYVLVSSDPLLALKASEELPNLVPMKDYLPGRE
jgi:hypothetical protein